MKIGYSSVCCPTWDLRTMIEQAVLLGYDGIELRGLQGELHLPQHPELAQNYEAVIRACETTHVELVCLGSSASFGHSKKEDIADQKAIVRGYIDLAEKLRCPFVRVFTGDIPLDSDRHATLSRITEALQGLASYAGHRKISILIENSGDLAGSRDLWFFLDAISHPALRACWNPIHGLSLQERSTLAIPRIGKWLEMIHVCDARMEEGALVSYEPLGAGNTDIPRLLELAQGIGFNGYLMVEWPKLWNDSLLAPEQYLPQSAQYLKSQLSLERPPLSAYKGDKNAPRFASHPARMPT